MHAATTAPVGERRPPVSARASAELLIDRERLSDLLGRPVRATRLRFKPGLSTTAVLLEAERDAAGEETAPQWIQVSHQEHLDKLRNAIRRAAHRHQQVHVLRAGDLTIAHGDIDSDPRLQRGLDGLRGSHPSVRDAVASGRVQVLRYNPQRRLVLRRVLPHQEDLVLRLTADKQPDVRADLAAYAAAGVPVVEPVSVHGLRRTRRLTLWPWFGRGDLARLPDAADAADAAVATGVALARLHRADVRHEGVPDPVTALQALVEDLTVLDGPAAGRMRALVRECADRLTATAWATGPVHGDFSADQVLVGREGEDAVRLTDFDRAGHGPLLADLGSFAAAELLGGTERLGGTEQLGATGDGQRTSPADLAALPLTSALLVGYGTTADAPALPTQGGLLRTWVARALLSRVTEPFRSGDPDWTEGIHRRLDQVQEVLR